MGAVKISAAASTAFAFCALAACATPQEARSKGPVESYPSQKSARVVADCISDALEARGHSSEMYVRPLANGYSIQVARYGNTLIAVDVLEAAAGGSITNYYRGTVIGGNKALKADFAACQ